MPDDKNLFNFLFENKLYGKKPSESYRRRRRFTSTTPVAEFFEGGYENLLKNVKNVFYHDGEFNRKVLKQAFLKFTYSTYFIVSKKELACSLRADIADLFNIALDKLTDDQGMLLPFVQTMSEIQEDFFEIVRKHCTNYEDIIVPESFVITRKRQAITEEMRKITISVKLFNQYGRTKLERIKLEKLFNFKEPIYYGTKKQEDEMKKAVEIFRIFFDSDAIVSNYNGYEHKFNHTYKKKILFIILSTNNIKYLSFCKDARPLKTIYNTLFYRKAETVNNYFQTYPLIEQYSLIPSLYMHAKFENVNKKFFEKVKTVSNFISTLNYKNNNLSHYKYNLDSYFNTNNTDLTSEQKKFQKAMTVILKLHEKNSDTLRFISTPYRPSDMMEDKLIEILKKVMVF